MSTGIDVRPDTWVRSGNGMIAASDTLASAVDTLCDGLSSAGACWGSDDIGRAFFNGDGKTPGFGKMRDALLADLADMVNLLRGTGGMLIISGRTYAVAEEASTIGSALPPGASQGALAQDDPYRLPDVAGHLVESDPPPSEFMQILGFLESLVAGCQWPDGNMASLASMRDALRDAATSIDSVARDVDGHSRTVTDNNAGDATQKFASFAAALQGGGDEGGLAWLADACRNVAGAVDTLIKQKNAARMQFELSLAFLAATWAVALAASWISAGTSVAAATATTEAEGLALRAFLMNVAKSVLAGMWFGGGLDAIGQYSRIHEGLQKGFNAGELVKATAEGGIAGGVMGGAAGWVGMRGNRLTTALSEWMGASGAKGAASRFLFNGVTATAGNVAAQAAVDHGHVDLTQAAEFGFGMAGLEGAKEAGKHAASYFRGDASAPGDPGLNPSVPRTDLAGTVPDLNGGDHTPARTGDHPPGHPYGDTTSRPTGTDTTNRDTAVIPTGGDPVEGPRPDPTALAGDTAGLGDRAGGAPAGPTVPVDRPADPPAASPPRDDRYVGVVNDHPEATPPAVEQPAGRPPAQGEGPVRVGEPTSGGNRPSVADILSGKTSATSHERSSESGGHAGGEPDSKGGWPTVEPTGSSTTGPVHETPSQHEEGATPGAAHDAGYQHSTGSHQAEPPVGVAYEAPGRPSDVPGTAHEGSSSPFQILADPGLSGDGYAAPGLWGKYGASGALIKNTDAAGTERFLIVQRGPEVSSNVGKWQLPGGALDSHETPAQGAAREISEELGVGQDYLDTLSLAGSHVVETPSGWTYTTLAAEAPEMFDPRVDGTETGNAKWVTAQELHDMAAAGQLHPALAKSLPDVMALFDKPVQPASAPHALPSHDGGQAPEPQSSDGAPAPSHGGAPHETSAKPHEPAVMRDYTKIGGPTGSNVGGRYLDPTGKEWYVKAPASDLHAMNEVLANDLYRAAGVSVPEVKLLDLDGNFGAKHLGVQSAIVDGSQNLGAHLDDPAYLNELHENFAVDAWLANWDIVGLTYDNIIETDSGLLRIDAGGSLLFRAQGGPKGDLFTDTVGEIETLRNPYINPQSAKVFEGVTEAHIRAGVAKIQAISEHQIDQLVDRHHFSPDDAAYLKEKLKARRNDLIARYGEPKPVDFHPADAPTTKLDQSHDGPAAPTKPPAVHAKPPEPSSAHVATVDDGANDPLPVKPSEITKALSGADWPPTEPHTTPAAPTAHDPWPAEPSEITKALSGADWPPTEPHTTPAAPTAHDPWPAEPSEITKALSGADWPPTEPHTTPAAPTAHDPSQASQQQPLDSPSSMENTPTQPLSEHLSPPTGPPTPHGVPEHAVTDDPDYRVPTPFGDATADPPIDALQVPPSYGNQVWDDVITNLSPEHEATIKTYTNWGYREINEHLRSGNPPDSIPHVIRIQIERLAEVARMRPTPRDIDVVRGVDSNAFSVPMRKLKGTVQTDAGFMSTSLGDKPAFDFKDVILHLRVPAGTPAVYLERISQHKGEHELLLIHGRRWLPTEVEIRKDKWGVKTYHVYGKILPDE